MTPLRVVVVGGGSWGSVFAALLAERGHEVTLACRDAEQARAIAETGRNPRYIPDADLSGITAVGLGRPRSPKPSWSSSPCRAARSGRSRARSPATRRS